MKQDRRVERTRLALRTALLDLVREHAFEPLTVQQIADRANVGRATFYAHFDNKEDLLLSGLDELRETLRRRQREALLGRGTVEQRTFAFSYTLFEHAHEHRAVFRALVGRQSGAAVERVLHRLLVDLVRDDLRTMTARGRPAESAVQLVAGGLFGVLLWWLKGRKGPTVAEIDALFRRFALPAVKALAG